MADIETTQDTGAATQEQIDNAPEYSGADRDTSYAQSQNEIKAPKEAAKEATQPDTKQTLEFTHNGKQVKGTLEQVLKWAQQGYDYPQKMQQLNQQTNRWNAEKQQWEQKWGQYKQIDEYAKTNPQWWNTVKQQWETRGTTPQTTEQTQAGNQPDRYQQEIQALKDQLAQVAQPVQQYLTLQQQEQVKGEDLALDNEIKSIRDKYKDLDLDAIDESGKSLEFRVLEHASQHGIKSFQTAFRDLCHDQILANAQQQAKLNVASEVQKNSRLGVLGKSPTPQTKGFQPVQNIRNKSYNDIDAETLAELKAAGISLTGAH